MSRTRGGKELVVGALLGLALALPAAADRRLSPEEARARLDRAAAACDLRASSGTPVRLRALVRALRLSTGDHAGRYELAWDSPDRWRLEMRFAGYHSVEAIDEEGPWQRSGVPWVPVRVRQIREGLDVASLLRPAEGESVTAAHARGGIGGRRVEIELDGGPKGPRRIELDADDGLPLAVHDPQLTHEFDDWTSVDELVFPRSIVVSDAGGPIATATLRRLAREPSLHPSLFLRPADARSVDAVPDADSPVWEAYRARLAAFFERSWQLPREARLGREGVVRLAFAVQADGEIRNLRLLESSGSEELDRSALAAILSATPLPSPPLPPDADALEVSWSVVYNLDGRAASLAGVEAEPRATLYAGTRPISGPATPELADVDALMLDFLAAQDAPGAALAIVRDGRLVHARGYGWADHASGEPVRPDSLFRIASLSKPLTAMTLLSLVEDGLVDLNDSPWSLLGLEETAIATDPRHGRLSLKLLLQHRGGIDRRNATDPFVLAAESGRAWPGGAAPAGDELARGLAERPLDFEPGSRFAYSNSGYALLGRVIERVTGTSYEQAVRERLLEPLGLESMRLGRSRAEDRQPGEARPHLRSPRFVPAADGSGEILPLAEGGFAIESMDAQGGWLASAIDLARISEALDRPKRSGLLGRRSVRRLWARPPGLAGFDLHGRMLARWYGCGWNVRVAGPRGELEQWHGGRLPGSSSLLVRQADGTRWVVLFNQDRGADGTLLSAALEPRLRELLAHPREWPEQDLFAARP